MLRIYKFTQGEVLEILRAHIHKIDDTSVQKASITVEVTQDHDDPPVTGGILITEEFISET